MPSVKKRRPCKVEKLAGEYRVPASLTSEIALDFLSSLDCPRALTVALLLKNSEWQQLVDLEVDPLWYNDGVQFREAYTATLLLSKANFIKLEVSKVDAAVDKFQKFEALCADTNRRFRNLGLDPSFRGSSVALLNAMERKIAQILGDYSAEEVFCNGNWGPGVTTLVKGEHVSDINKFHDERGITQQMYSLIGDAFPIAYPGWYGWLVQRTASQTSIFTIQPGNVVVTVPKNSKTDRVIAIEPGFNLWFQKSVGTMIRKRLLRWGIDLNHQSRNQRLCRLASMTGHLATIDFSSASDSISTELIRAVVPQRWLMLLEACRSPVGYLGKRLYTWEKFSSMGNGFTFELESLIFYAAALVTAEANDVDTTDISVYGDDVILPSVCCQEFSSFCVFLGFKVNRQKSFSSGWFRESCGVHYWRGIDCKPVFLKERLTNASSVFKLANRIRDLAHRRCATYGCDTRFRDVWFRLVSGLPSVLQLGVSANMGDCGFHQNFDEAVPIRARDGIEGYTSRALLEVAVKATHESDALLLARLRAMSIQVHPVRDYLELPRPVPVLFRQLRHDIQKRTWIGCSSGVAKGNEYSLRGTTLLKFTKVLVPQWYDFGPWSA